MILPASDPEDIDYPDIPDLTDEERVRYERGEAIWRQEPSAAPNEVRGRWWQRMDFGKTYEEWKKKEV